MISQVRGNGGGGGSGGSSGSCNWRCGGSPMIAMQMDRIPGSGGGSASRARRQFGKLGNSLPEKSPTLPVLACEHCPYGNGTHG